MISDILCCLPDFVRSAIVSLGEESLGKLTEISLRAGRPVALNFGFKRGFLENGGISILPSQKNVSVTSDELTATLHALCQGSVYAHENEIREGYISLPSGGRAGVCGTTVVRSDGTRGLREVSGINIRLAHEIKGCAERLISADSGEGILICGAPHTGKTTLLRDFVRRISSTCERVSLIDCRGEISSPVNGVPSLDVGFNTDVFYGGTKSESIVNALRSMAPDAIAFDEIGSLSELNSLADCLSSGARVITTFHASSINGLLKRNRALPLLDTGAFGQVAMLNRGFGYKIYKVSDFFDKVDSPSCSGNMCRNIGSLECGQAKTPCRSASFYSDACS